jgi:acyl carrier protein
MGFNHCPILTSAKKLLLLDWKNTFTTHFMDDITTFTRKLENELDGVEPGSLQATTVYREIPAWSSMYALVLIALSETEYNVTLTGEDLRGCKTVQDLYDIIKSRTN